MFINTEGPAITDFVLDNLPDYNPETGEGGYQILNTSTMEEGDEIFTRILIENLPELSEMTPMNPLIAGSTVDVYTVEVLDRRFVVKILAEALNLYPATALDKSSKGFEFAKKYFSEYIPLTIHLERFSKRKNKMEYLVIQEELIGYQYKFLKENPNEVPIISPILKEKLEDILQKAARMLNDTGWVFDFDFILNPVDDNIGIFDFNVILSGGYRYMLLVLAAYLHDWFGINIPNELRLDVLSYN